MMQRGGRRKIRLGRREDRANKLPEEAVLSFGNKDVI